MQYRVNQLKIVSKQNQLYLSISFIVTSLLPSNIFRFFFFCFLPILCFGKFAFIVYSVIFCQMAVFLFYFFLLFDSNALLMLLTGFFYLFDDFFHPMFQFHFFFSFSISFFVFLCIISVRYRSRER